MELVLSIQYLKKNGQIYTVHGPTDKPPRNEDFPKEGTQLLVPMGTVTRGKRVNLSTLTLEDCPVFARNQERNEILRQLYDIDVKTPRAMREEKLTGKMDALQALEDKAITLRGQLAKLPEISPDV